MASPQTQLNVADFFVGLILFLVLSPVIALLTGWAIGIILQ